jgi:hypothetical protein
MLVNEHIRVALNFVSHNTYRGIVHGTLLIFRFRYYWHFGAFRPIAETLRFHGLKLVCADPAAADRDGIGRIGCDASLAENDIAWGRIKEHRSSHGE